MARFAQMAVNISHYLRVYSSLGTQTFQVPGCANGSGRRYRGEKLTPEVGVYNSRYLAHKVIDLVSKC